jgi:hypothetical protein
MSEAKDEVPRSPPSRRPKRVRLWLEFKSETQLRAWMAMLGMDGHLPLTANVSEGEPSFDEASGEGHRNLRLNNFL